MSQKRPWVAYVVTLWLGWYRDEDIHLALMNHPFPCSNGNQPRARHNKRQRNMPAERVNLDMMMTVRRSLLPFLIQWFTLGSGISRGRPQALALDRYPHGFIRSHSPLSGETPGCDKHERGLIITWKKMYPTYAIRNIQKQPLRDVGENAEGELWLREVIQIITCTFIFS